MNFKLVLFLLTGAQVLGHPVRSGSGVELAMRSDGDGDENIAYLDVVTDRDSDVSYEDVYVDMNGGAKKGRSDSDETIAYLDVVIDRDSDVSYEDVYVDMEGTSKLKE